MLHFCVYSWVKGKGDVILGACAVSLQDVMKDGLDKGVRCSVELVLPLLLLLPSSRRQAASADIEDMDEMVQVQGGPAERQEEEEKEEEEEVVVVVVVEEEKEEEEEEVVVVVVVVVVAVVVGRGYICDQKRSRPLQTSRV